MAYRDTVNFGDRADCTSTTSFTDHGLRDGAAMIRRTYYRLRDAGITDADASDRFFDQLEAAFIWSYLSSTDEAGVPPHVEAAIEDARERTRAAVDPQDDADLRTDVIPAFYQRVAGFHCLYR